MIKSLNLIQLKQILLTEEDKVLKFSLLAMCFFVLIVSSLLILRLDKLKLIFGFIIEFLKESRKR